MLTLAERRHAQPQDSTDAPLPVESPKPPASRSLQDAFAPRRAPATRMRSQDSSLRRSPAIRPEEESREIPAVQALVRHLADLGVERAFGVSGGAIALLFDALVDSPVELNHFRHETGAAFAACEASLATNRPVVVFATTGPGLLNSLTGLTAARWDGAKVILVSGATAGGQRGRWATQETSPYTLPQDALYGKSALFDFATRIENPTELPQVARRLAQGVKRPGGFVAHVCLPMGIQAQRVTPPSATLALTSSAPAPSQHDVESISRKLHAGSFAIWVGHGATLSADLVRELAERSGAPVFASPRAKGVMPEGHPQYLGVTGLGGHPSVTEYMARERPRHVLVLGTKLGEATSFWDDDMVPEESFLHVDIDPEVPGAAYPQAETVGIHAEIGAFLRALLQHFPRNPGAGEKNTGQRQAAGAFDEPIPLPVSGRSPVRPQVLMSAIQRKIVQQSDALVLAECGNSFAWCNHHLRFPSAGRYRVSTLFGSMGHAAAGVVGVALARGGKAVAVTGDGSMLMNSELSTAAQYGAQAVWIVLNDAGYGMCRDGHEALGLTGENIDIPRVDFVRMAEAVGAAGLRVESEDEVDEALRLAMESDRPFVVDVRIDADETSPLLARFESLIKQGNSKNVAGWERNA